MADHDTDKMNMQTGNNRRLLSSFVVAAVLFVLANVILVSNYVPQKRHLERAAFDSTNSAHPIQKATKSWSYWVAKGYVEQNKAPDVVLFGSSQMGSAIACADAQLSQNLVDTATHKELWSLETELTRRLGGKTVKVFNAAIPGCMISDVDLMSKVLFRDTGMKPKVVVVGIAPRDFLDNTLPSPSGTEPWHFFSQFVPVYEWPSQAFPDFFANLDWQINQHTMRELAPLAQAVLGTTNIDEQQAIEGKKNDTPLAAVLGTLGEVKAGQWLVPANIPPMWKDNTAEYKNRFRDSRHPIYKTEYKFFKAFLARMKQEGVQVIAVGMPSLPINRALLPDKFWAKFQSDMATACAENNAVYLPLYSDAEFEMADYLDTVHLDATGGQKLFARIASVMVGDEGIKVALEKPRPGLAEVPNQVGNGKPQ